MRKPNFIWNFDMLRDFTMQGISHRWFVPVIQGYCATDQNHSYLGQRMEVTLISRRHTARAGTRFQARGISEDGNVANFVETELIVKARNG